MTEAEWLTSSDPDGLLHWVWSSSMASPPDDLSHPHATNRRLRLFACACCRSIWPLLTDPRSRAAVEVSERFADGRATDRELREASTAAYEVTRLTVDEAALYAAFAASGVAEEESWLFEPAHVAANAASAGGHPEEERRRQCDILRDLFGNPFRPVGALEIEPERTSSDVVALAHTIYEDRTFNLFPILADALQDAGCDYPYVLDHCRDPNLTHYRGCWVLDLILGRS
jgi:hypothetical protein